MSKKEDIKWQNRALILFLVGFILMVMLFAGWINVKAQEAVQHYCEENYSMNHSLIHKHRIDIDRIVDKVIEKIKEKYYLLEKGGKPRHRLQVQPAIVGTVLCKEFGVSKPKTIAFDTLEKSIEALEHFMNESKPKPKYKCPNGCEDATFIEYIRVTTTLLYKHTPVVIDENGKYINKKRNSFWSDYFCQKCRGKFTEQQLIKAAEKYNKCQ